MNKNKNTEKPSEFDREAQKYQKKKKEKSTLDA